MIILFFQFYTFLFRFSWKWQIYLSDNLKGHMKQNSGKSLKEYNWAGFHQWQMKPTLTVKSLRQPSETVGNRPPPCSARKEQLGYLFSESCPCCLRIRYESLTSTHLCSMFAWKLNGLSWLWWKMLENSSKGNGWHRPCWNCWKYLELFTPERLILKSGGQKECTSLRYKEMRQLMGKFLIIGEV